MGAARIAESHPLAMGPLTAQPEFGEVIGGADVVLAVGTRFQGGATRNWTLPIPGKLIHLDADPAVIGRNYAPAVALVGDAELGLAALLKGSSDVQERDAEFTARSQSVRDAVRTQIRKQIGPDYSAIMDTMRELLPLPGCIVRDATVPAYLWGNRAIPIPATANINPLHVRGDWPGPTARHRRRHWQRPEDGAHPGRRRVHAQHRRTGDSGAAQRSGDRLPLQRPRLRRPA